MLRGVRACLKPDGRILFQMGGRGNAADVVAAIEKLVQRPQWKKFFGDFRPQKYYYGPDDYERWLPASGFQPVRIELIPKDMQHKGTEGLKGWFRTTWFPYTDCVPEDLREPFLDELADAYTAEHPIDAQGIAHVKMVRLEVEAHAA
jgi:trans-aconitate methyltransferase